MILAGDIGGTHTRLGLFSLAQGKLVPEAEATYLSQEHASLDKISQAFIAAHRCPLGFRPRPPQNRPRRGRK
jgi:glucokinase